MKFNSAYRVQGLSLQDKIGVFGGDEDPRTIDTSEVPVGSAYFQSNGAAWKRIGTEASAWVQLVAEEMMLLNLGLAMGADGWTYPMQLAGQRNQELMVRDDQVIQLLHELLMQQKKVNGYLSIITGENLDTDLQGDE
ncbi:MAG: hypothetical protein HQL75_00295 [Magnetococcales bacterium]|nr:hypothetical protein [Magnetococcales bacterium]